MTNLDEQVSALAAQPEDHLQLMFLANFANGSLSPSVDHLHFGDLQEGDGQVAGSDPTWTPEAGAIELGVTKPDTSDDPVSAGLFVTPVSFGTGSVFHIQATFVAPVGPHATGNVWAAAVSVRTGGKDDLGTATRAGVTFQVRGSTARMNVLGVNETITGTTIPPAVYDSIFSPNAPEQFTLELLVDRRTGEGIATFKAGSTVITRDVTFSEFRADSGPTITAVGPALAIVRAAAPPATASVEVRELRISAPKP